jgi:hypothetical protein
MTTRERFLAKGVGIAVVLAIGWQAVDKLVVKPAQAVKEDLRNQTDRRAELEEEVAKARGVKVTWRGHTRRSLSLDPNDASLYLKDEIATLLDEHGLTEDRTITSRSYRTNKKTGITEVPVHVRVTARLPAVVDFLRDFYQKPYYVQVESISLRPERTGRRSARSADRSERVESGAADRNRADRNRPDRNRTGRPRVSPRRTAEVDKNPKLAVTLLAKTLVLPEQDKQVVKHPLFRPHEEEPDPSRLAEEDLSAYDAIVTTNPFVKYVKPKEPPKPPGNPQRNETREVVQRVDPRKDADNFRLVGTVVLNKKPIAYVRDERDEGAAAQKYSPGDKIDHEGEVVLVHTKGMVLRSEEGEDGRKEVTYYFYPIGTNFKQREVLDPSRHPEITSDPRLISST